jgi:predicted lipoprotein with Yx(FWY)xxD motif
MRKSGWAAATGLGALVLLLAACGGSSGSSSAAVGGAASATANASSGSSAPAPATTSVSAASTATKKGGSTPTASPSKVVHQSVGPQPSSGTVSFPPIGTTVMVIVHTNLGFVLAEASGQVVYTYAKDKKNGAPTCTGSCAAAWPPATGTPKAGPADHFPGTFGVVKGAGGVEQITYDGMPLYTLKGAKPYTTAGNNAGGVWHVIPMSASYIG